jgi:hypothetical protein
MKLHLRHIVLTAGLSALLGSITLNAQDRKPPVRGNISGPFSFGSIIEFADEDLHGAKANDTRQQDELIKLDSDRKMRRRRRLQTNQVTVSAARQLSSDQQKALSERIARSH